MNVPKIFEFYYGESTPTPPVINSFLLKEDGFYLLQENGDKIIL